MRSPEKIFTETNYFSSLDVHFSRFISRLAKDDSPELGLAAALVSQGTGQGNACLDLAALAGLPLPPASGHENQPGITTAIICPALPDWLAGLRQSGVVGEPGAALPLILDLQNRLYLHRYWEYEKTVAEYLKSQDRCLADDLDLPLLAAGLRRLFPAAAGQETDWQMIAATAALLRPFCVITGGPGTGKSSTVTKIIALLLEQAGSNKTLRVRLAAPTGKAAGRLQETISREKEKLSVSEKVLAGIPAQASTLHRLLGSIAGSPYFRFNDSRPLDADVVIVDEASMMDLPLLAKLLMAMPATARLILLGDRHQLSSVEPGAVLADICHPDFLARFSGQFSELLCRLGISADLAPGPAVQTPGLADMKPASFPDSLVELRRTYRFSPASGIQKLSLAVKLGDPALVFDVLNDESLPDVSWQETPSPKDIGARLREKFDRLLQDLLQADSPDRAFAVLNSFRILCALRQGPYGALAVNKSLEEIIAGQGGSKHFAAAGGPLRSDFRGRPLMITRNSYSLQLYNGDVGIMLPDHETADRLLVFFPDLAGGFRKLHPLRLPPHETVFALTVHKSQGSEFDSVLLILPDSYSPVLARELIYTAVTRARKNVEIWSGQELLKAAVAAQAHRHSGLRDAIWGGPPAG